MSDAVEQHLRLHEVADRLGISLATVRRYIQAGKFPSIRPAGTRIVLVPESAVLAFLRGPRA